LKAVLEVVQNDYKQANDKEFELIEAIYEKVFRHKAFTGRSGTFFAFEVWEVFIGTWYPSCYWPFRRF
jgi:hypothetical protein